MTNEMKLIMDLCNALGFDVEEVKTISPEYKCRIKVHERTVLECKARDMPVPSPPMMHDYYIINYKLKKKNSKLQDLRPTLRGDGVEIMKEEFNKIKDEDSSKRQDIDCDAAWKIAIDKANADIARLYPSDYSDRIQIESHRMSLVYKEYIARIRP